MGAWPKPWGRDQGLGGMSKAKGALPKPWGVAKAVGAW